MQTTMIDFLPISRKIKCPHCPSEIMWQDAPSDTGGYEVECPVCRTRSKFTVDGYRMYSYQYIDSSSVNMVIHKYIVN